MNIQHTLERIVSDALAKLDISSDHIEFEHPNELEHGDYSTNIAMTQAHQQQQSPRELAMKIVEAMDLNNQEMVDKVDIAGPGFINFYLSSVFFGDQVKTMRDNADAIGGITSLENDKVIIEHSSPNLMKSFHIGHMMNNMIGESLVRIFESTAAEVITLSYPSDVSLGIAKAIWKLLEYGVDNFESLLSNEEKVSLLGKLYAEGTQAYDENPDIESKIREIAAEIYEQKNSNTFRAYLIAREVNLAYFSEMTARLGSRFDGLVFESEAGEVGKQLVVDNTPKVFTESDNAIVYDGEQDNLHTRVFINKEGNPTYEAKDLGLLDIKFERYNPEQSIVVTDSQQGPYYEVVLAAAGKINPLWKERSVHVMHGRMSFKGQKMSSRLGNVPLVSEILETVGNEVTERSDKDLSLQEIDAITIAALKYSILRVQTGKNINFDPEQALSFEGDSGPYLQYSYARAQSLLRKAREQGLEPNNIRPDDWETLDLERMMYRLPEKVSEASTMYSPHVVANYIMEVAHLFNSWYGNTKIIDVDDPQSSYRLAVVDATAKLIKKSLWMLGIEVLEEM